VTSCVIVRDGRLLLLRRAIAPGIGKWAFPAGFVEPGETAEQAIAREVLEETRLAVRVSYLRSWARDLGGGESYLGLCFRGEIVGGDEVVTDHESLEHAWIPLERSALEELEWAFETHRLTALELADE
jgi:ADP-ribose pyrophosphatase YjhB (NUDIX family)